MGLFYNASEPSLQPICYHNHYSGVQCVTTLHSINLFRHILCIFYKFRGSLVTD